MSRINKHFLHFGCWNKGHSYLRDNNNTDIASNLTNVMRKLNEVCDQIHPDFIVVAGDNYYPTKQIFKDGDKTKSIKILNEEDLKSGFDSLPKNVEVDVIMGNHDYETNLYVPENDQFETSCKILKLEYDFEKRQNHNLDVVIHKARKINETTLILMIDTTIYDDDYVADIIDCYKIHPDFMIKKPTIENVRQYQSEFIQKNILGLIDTIENIIIIGHHPITGFKLKKGKTKLIDTPGYPFVNMLFNDIFKFISNIKERNRIKYYYLCADLHQYQIGNINISPQNNSEETMNIKQYIVGTGGADLDPYPFDRSSLKENEIKRDHVLLNNSSDMNYMVDYVMTPEQLKLSSSNYGFLQCSINEDRLSFKFINIDGVELIEQTDNQVIDHITSGGKKRKFKTRKVFKQLKSKSKSGLKKSKTRKTIKKSKRFHKRKQKSKRYK